jgi:hypothetical protein
MAVPFDLGRREVTGQPVPVIANVMQALSVLYSPSHTAAGQFSISDSGVSGRKLDSISHAQVGHGFSQRPTPGAVPLKHALPFEARTAPATT